MGKRCLLGVADAHPAKTEEASFRRGLGDRLAYMLQPGFEGRGVPGSLRTNTISTSE
jgi:hypothetical protein